MSSSPIRFLHALLRDLDPYSAEDDYASFFGAEIDGVVKGNDLGRLLDVLREYDDPHGLHRPRFDGVLTRLHGALRDIDPRHADRLLRRVLALLGFSRSDYQMDARGLRIGSYARFMEGVMRLRARVSRC